MRRGLMAWSQDEVAARVFEQRVAALVSGMRARDLDCVLAYTDFARPAAVSALAHFIPYWGNGVLVVIPSSGATLVATLSRRVNDWIQSTARLDGLVNTLDLGAGVAECLPKSGDRAMRVGVIELSSLPSTVIAGIRKSHPQTVFEDASDLLAAALAGAERGGGVIAQRCMAIARISLSAGTTCSGRKASDVLAATEGAARLEGAEEILLAMAPDVAADPRLRRIEGPAAVGDVFMLQASVAYKGSWVRLGRTLAAGAPHPWITDTDAWYEKLVTEIAAGAPAKAAIDTALARLPGATLEAWRLESARAGLALAVADGSAPFSTQHRLLDSLYTLTLRLRRAEGWWFGASPFVFSRAGRAGA